MRSRISLAIASVATIALSAYGPPMAHAQNTGDHRTITASGRGEINVKPDLAILFFAVETTAPTAASAGEQNAAASTKVAAALKSMLGKDDKLKTTRYSLQPRYEMKREPGEPKILGYIASNEVQVETAAIDAVGKLIDTAIAAGANRVNNLMFTVKDRNPYVRQALDQAGTEAKAQAEAAAKALDVRLKQLLTATTMAPPIIMPRMHEGFGRAAMADTMTPVEPGEVAVSAELTVTYEIE